MKMVSSPQGHQLKIRQYLVMESLRLVLVEAEIFKAPLRKSSSLT
jgi:hypothetical protein